MANSNSISDQVICVQNYGNQLQKIVSKINFKLNWPGKIVWKYSDSKDIKFSIAISKPVWFDKAALTRISQIVENSNCDYFYFDHFLTNLKTFSKKQLLPIWSPYRYQQINFLGPVLVVSSQIKFYQDIFTSGLRIQNPEIASVLKPEGFFYRQFGKNSDSKRILGNDLNKRFSAEAPKKISIIIPTRGTKLNGYVLAEKLLKSIEHQVTEKSEYEIIFVYDTDSELDYLQTLKSDRIDISIKLISYSEKFNFSKKCNLGASHSEGQVLIFLNDDTEFISDNALLSLAGTAMQPKVGAVGAKLFFENKSIQHAGVIVIDDNVGHAYFKQKFPDGPFGDLDTIHEVSGVTGACLAQQKCVWEAIGGWDEEFENSYNDVEYCFRLREAGYSILQNNVIELFHFESISRDPTFSPNAKQVLITKWNKYLKDDPYFPDYVFKQKQKRIIRVLIKRILRKLNIR